jgi:23S rRNA (adenine2503-C2)-methyltransferase
VFIEYLMLRGVNDTQDDAEELVTFIKKLKKPFLAHVNLIPYNETDSKYKPSSAKTIKAFRDTLAHHRTNATIRKSLGGNIEAACGQLKTSK